MDAALHSWRIVCLFTEMQNTSKFVVDYFVSVLVCVFGCSQTFQVRIIDDEEYEKHENFFIVLEEPRWLKRGISGTSLQDVAVIHVRISFDLKVKLDLPQTNQEE